MLRGQFCAPETCEFECLSSTDSRMGDEICPCFTQYSLRTVSTVVTVLYAVVTTSVVLHRQIKQLRLFWLK